MIRVACLSEVETLTVTPKGEGANLGECWRKCVLEKVANIKALKSLRVWHAWKTKGSSLWGLFSEKRERGENRIQGEGTADLTLEALEVR